MMFLIVLLLTGCADIELVCTPGVIENGTCDGNAEPYVVDALSCGDYRSFGAQVLRPFEEEVTCAEAPDRECCVCAVVVPSGCTGATND